MRQLLLFVILKILLVFNNVECKNRQTYYASIGSSQNLRCISGGSYWCYSTYTFRNVSHAMVMLNSSMKYNVQGGSLTINNIEATDAGFYGCSSNCNQMRSDLIDFYLIPMCKQHIE